MSDIWCNREPTFESPYYPYTKVVEADTLKGAEYLPYMLTRYLMDLPDGCGYIPPDDNKYPRVRLKKLLYWDTPLPLEQPLPTPEQMKSIQFDPAHPATPPDEERGYRIFSQEFSEQAQANAQSILRIYMGNATPIERNGVFITRQTVIFTVLVNNMLEANSKMQAASRSYAMIQAIKESTAGVNFSGIGAMTMQSLTKVDDERRNTGYKLYQTIDWHGGTPF